jgi:aminoglycoside/choline kinase family phosphotransferase
VISVVDERKALLAEWLDQDTPFSGRSLDIASADASFRRYFRINFDGQNYIVMDAPPDLEDSSHFVKIAEWMKSKDIQVPEIFAKDLNKGFMVLSDFGDFHFQDALENQDRDYLYDLAMEEIGNMQCNLLDAQNKLPEFDQSWQNKELDIFREWCLPHLSVKKYQQSTEALVKGVNLIPKAFMHRDFHCRNLLLCSEKKLGIIDFQGAMFGPVTYDLVSLLRDCYVDNDTDWIDQQVLQFQQKLQRANLSYASTSEEQFLRWFDLAGLQRHLKCVGIFHRLKIRDNKPEYLKDVPRVLKYITDVLTRHPDLCDLHNLVNQASILN